MEHKNLDIFDFFQTHHLLDREGRPLSEDFSDMPSNNQEKWTQCPYHDGRRGKQMNVAALKQYYTHEEYTHAIVAYCQSVLLNHTNAKAGTLEFSWKTALLGRWLVHYCANIISNYIPSPSMAVTYKMMRGLHDMLTHSFIQGFEAKNLLNLDSLMEFIKEKKLLITKETVCAAPPSALRKEISFISCTNTHFSNQQLALEDQKTVSKIYTHNLLDYTDIMWRLELISGLLLSHEKNIHLPSIKHLKIHKNSYENLSIFGRVCVSGYYLSRKQEKAVFEKAIDKLTELSINKTNQDLLLLNERELLEAFHTLEKSYKSIFSKIPHKGELYSA